MKRLFLFILSLGLLSAQMPKEARAICPMSVSGAQKPSCCKSKKAMPCCKYQKAEPSPEIIAVPSVQADRSQYVIALVVLQIEPKEQFTQRVELTNHSPPQKLVLSPVSLRAPPTTYA